MKEPYLEITYRHGRSVAAYLYRPRGSRDRSRRTAKAPGGLVIDFARSGKPIGIEMTAPSKVTATGLNRVLRELGLSPIKRSDPVPLRAA